MTKAGFYPVKVVKTQARVLEQTDEGRAAAKAKEAFTKHLVMYQHPDIFEPDGRGFHGQVGYVGDHAGRCSIQMFAGLLELICGNGLVAGRVAEAIRLSHVRLSVVDVINAAFKMMESIGKVSEWRGELKSIPISLETGVELAREAMLLRWESVEKAPVYATQLLARRREGDTYANLWGAYQIIEENLRRGGQRPAAAYDRYWSVSHEEQKALVLPRKVVGISALDATLKFETEISNLADDWRIKLAA